MRGPTLPGALGLRECWSSYEADSDTAPNRGLPLDINLGAAGPRGAKTGHARALRQARAGLAATEYRCGFVWLAEELEMRSALGAMIEPIRSETL